MGKTRTGIIDRLLEGDPRALGRVITSVENGRDEGYKYLRELYPLGGEGQVVGITGAPGAGKSTLVYCLARAYREEGKRVGIIAVDPTSPFSGGALLGDRIRMQKLFTDPGIFIRSMATRGSTGGLALTTIDVVDVLNAAGFDLILVETIGVGQDEVDIIRAVDTVLVVVVPGMGDDIQTLKAGIMEIGDVFVVNKADHEGVNRTVIEIKSMLELGGERPWKPSICLTIALRDEGMEELTAAIEEHSRFLINSEAGAKRRFQQSEYRVQRSLSAGFLSRFQERLIREKRWHDAVEDVAERKRDPYTVVEDFLREVL